MNVRKHFVRDNACHYFFQVAVISMTTSIKRIPERVFWEWSYTLGHGWHVWCCRGMQGRLPYMHKCCTFGGYCSTHRGGAKSHIVACKDERHNAPMASRLMNTVINAERVHMWHARHISWGTSHTYVWASPHVAIVIAKMCAEKLDLGVFLIVVMNQFHVTKNL